MEPKIKSEIGFVISMFILLFLIFQLFVHVDGGFTAGGWSGKNDNNKLKSKTVPPRRRNRYEQGLLPNHQSKLNSRLNTMDQAVGGSSANQMLLRKLFRNYIREAMPDSPVLIHFDLLLIKLKSSSEKEGFFESVIGLFIVINSLTLTSCRIKKSLLNCFRNGLTKE